MHTFALRHRLFERGVHSFRVIHTSPVSLSAQAFFSIVCLLAQAPSYFVHVYGQQLNHKLYSGSFCIKMSDILPL